MTNLVMAYQNDDIAEFEKILRLNRYSRNEAIHLSLLSMPSAACSFNDCVIFGLFIYFNCTYWYRFVFVFRQPIMEDHFIREHIEDLLKNIRTQVLVKLIRPYTRIRITFIAKVCGGGGGAETERLHSWSGRSWMYGVV